MHENWLIWRWKKALPRHPIHCPAPFCTCDCLQSPPCQLCSSVIPAEGLWACSPQSLPSALGFRLESTVLASPDFFKASVRRVHVQNHLPGLEQVENGKHAHFGVILFLWKKSETSTGLLFVGCQTCLFFFSPRQKKPSLNLIISNTKIICKASPTHCKIAT